MASTIYTQPSKKITSTVIKKADVSQHAHAVDINKIFGNVQFTSGVSQHYSETPYKTYTFKGTTTITLDRKSKIIVTGSGYNFSSIYINSYEVSGSSLSYQGNYYGLYYFDKGATIKVSVFRATAYVSLYQYYAHVEGSVKVIE